MNTAARINSLSIPCSHRIKLSLLSSSIHGNSFTTHPGFGSCPDCSTNSAEETTNVESHDAVGAGGHPVPGLCVPSYSQSAVDGVGRSEWCIYHECDHRYQLQRHQRRADRIIRQFRF